MASISSQPVLIAYLRKFFVLSGRINRASFWGRSILVNFLSSVVVRATLDNPADDSVFPTVLGFCATIVGIYCFSVVSVKRLHDFSWSGWWAWLVIIPPLTLEVMGGSFFLAATGLRLLTMIVLGTIPGSNGENRFGNPKSG